MKNRVQLNLAKQIVEIQKILNVSGYGSRMSTGATSKSKSRGDTRGSSKRGSTRGDTRGSTGYSRD